MKLRNKATLLLLDQIETVQVSFDSYLEGLTKLYTYKAKKGVYSKGDQALVIVNGKYKVVEVQIVDPYPTIDPSVDYEYQWLAQKISLSEYNKCIAAEDTLVDYLIQAERTTVIKAIQEELKEQLPEAAIQISIEGEVSNV